jgi:hypothetical protein
MMKFAKRILCGISAIGFATGAAVAGDWPGDSSNHPFDSMSGPAASGLNYESRTDGSIPSVQPTQPSGDSVSYLMVEPVQVSYVDVYDIDTDRDGRADGQLLLEQSDTLAMVTPVPASPSEVDLESSSSSQ